MSHFGLLNVTDLYNLVNSADEFALLMVLPWGKNNIFLTTKFMKFYTKFTKRSFILDAKFTRSCVLGDYLVFFVVKSS
jgi:hypothetical protein